MILHKFFLLPIILAVSCTAAQPISSGNGNAARTQTIMERNIAASDTAVNNLQQSKIDRNRLQITPVRMKNMNPDSIPQP
jgi:hypothetical protein